MSQEASPCAWHFCPNLYIKALRYLDDGHLRARTSIVMPLAFNKFKNPLEVARFKVLHGESKDQNTGNMSSSCCSHLRWLGQLCLGSGFRFFTDL